MSDVEGSDAEEVIVPLTEEEKAEQLIAACKGGDLDKAQELFADGAVVACRDGKGWSPLVWASFHGFEQLVALLLQHGADSDYRKERDSIEAAARAEEAKASGSLQRAEREEGRDRRPVTINSPLHWAAFKGRTRVVWQLLLHDFSVTDIDENGNNALHLACAGGHPDIVRTLMQQGFEVDLRNGYGVDAVCLSTNSEVQALLKKAIAQEQCPVSRRYFGGEVKRYLCDCTQKFFTEDCSQPQHIFASVEEDIRRPVRYSSRALEMINDAEARLHEALNPGAAELAVGASAADATDSVEQLPPANAAPVELQRQHLPALEDALAGVKGVGGDIRLIATAEKARDKLVARNSLEDEVAALRAKRPLKRRTAVKPLLAAMAHARSVGVDESYLTDAVTLAELAVAECKLRGAVVVCGNITLATHAHDGDMKRLRDSHAKCSELGAEPDLLEKATTLYAKLDTEVALFDVVNDVQAAWENVQAVVAKCAEEYASPSYELLPRPEPIPGPDGEMVAPPTREMVALDALNDQLARLDDLAIRAPETGASEELTAKARAAHTELTAAWTEAVAVETERAEIEEAARVKLEKKLRKKNKKKKKKK